MIRSFGSPPAVDELLVSIDLIWRSVMKSVREDLSVKRLLAEWTVVVVFRPLFDAI